MSQSKQKKEVDYFFGTSSDLPKIVEIDLTHIIPNPHQPRKQFDEESLNELKTSIERHGLIQPVTVKKSEDSESYILVAGERRYRAHQMLGKKTIAAIITKGNLDEIALIENIQREDLKPLEEASAYAKMIERYSYTQEELANVIGKARSTVTNILKINLLPDEIKEECSTSNVSKSVLMEIAGLPDQEQQMAFWNRVRWGGMTVKAARRAIKDGSAPKKILSPTEHMLAIGRSFTRKLAQIPPDDLLSNAEQYTELLELQKQINEFVDRIPQHNG